MLRIPHCLYNRLTDGGKIVGPTHPETLFPFLWYPFLLEAECTPRPSAAGTIRHIEEIHARLRVSNPRPSGLRVVPQEDSNVYG
jgi:hypothetical protein